MLKAIYTCTAGRCHISSAHRDREALRSEAVCPKSPKRTAKETTAGAKSDLPHFCISLDLPVYTIISHLLILAWYWQLWKSPPLKARTLEAGNTGTQRPPAVPGAAKRPCCLLLPTRIQLHQTHLLTATSK